MAAVLLASLERIVVAVGWSDNHCRFLKLGKSAPRVLGSCHRRCPGYFHIFPGDDGDCAGVCPRRSAAIGNTKQQLDCLGRYANHRTGFLAVAFTAPYTPLGRQQIWVLKGGSGADLKINWFNIFLSPQGGKVHVKKVPRNCWGSRTLADPDF